MIVSRRDLDRIAGVIAIPSAVAVLTTVVVGAAVFLLALVIWGLTR